MAEQYRLKIVRLTSTQGLGSGTQLLDSGWILSYSGIAGERQRDGLGLLIAPQLSCHVLEFSSVNKRVASLCLSAGEGSVTVVSVNRLNRGVEYQSPWEE